MKALSRILAAASLISALSVPAMAAEKPAAPAQHDQGCQKECALLLKDCRVEVDTLQEKISKLQTAIEKNSAAYTNEQLKQLRQELEKATYTLSDLSNGGA